jgi:hypothetical protein
MRESPSTQATQTTPRAKPQDKKLPASNYGFPNHDDGIQSGDTFEEDIEAYKKNPQSPPDGLAGQ